MKLLRLVLKEGLKDFTEAKSNIMMMKYSGDGKPCYIGPLWKEELISRSLLKQFKLVQRTDPGP